MGAGDAHRIELAAVALHAAAQGLVHQVSDLLARDLHIRQPLAGQQQLGGEGVAFLLPFGAKTVAGFGVLDGGAADLHPLLQLQHLVGTEADGEAIEQVVAHRPFLGIEGGDQQAATGVAEAQPLALDPILTAAHRRQQQVGDVVVEQVELIHIEHAPMGLRQQARLEHRLATGQRGGDIHRAHEAVFGDAERHLHKRSRNHPGGQQGGRVAARGISPQLGEAAAGGFIPVVGALGIDVQARGNRLTGDGWAQIQNVDRRQQGMQPARQHRFAGAAATGDHHPAQARIHGGQQQGQLEGAVASDGRQGKGAGGGAGGRSGAGTAPGQRSAGHRSACNHGVARALSRARQSR